MGLEEREHILEVRPAGVQANGSGTPLQRIAQEQEGADVEGGAEGSEEPTHARDLALEGSEAARVSVIRRLGSG